MSLRICPWYIGYFLANPLRKLYQNPEKILAPFISSGMKVLEVGPGMGFFSLPMACMVGEQGRIYCIDVQEKMLKSLNRRAERAKLNQIIETRLCTESSLQIEDLSGTIDFVLAFAVVHEIPDHKSLFLQMTNTLRKGGKLLISEPTGHVSKDEFDATIALVQCNGMKIIEIPVIRASFSALLEKM